MKTKLNPHYADSYFVHNTETGVNKMQIEGKTVSFKNTLRMGVVENSVRLWDGMQDDGRGNIVDREGCIVGSIDYETGILNVDPIKYQVLEIVTSSLGNASDNVDRIERCIEWVKNAHDLGAPQDNGSSAHRKKNVDTYFWRIDIGFKEINANNGSNNGDYLVISSKLYPVATDGMQKFKLVTECFPFGDVNKQHSVDQGIIDQISKITEEYVAKIADTMPPI